MTPARKHINPWKCYQTLSSKLWALFPIPERESKTSSKAWGVSWQGHWINSAKHTVLVLKSKIRFIADLVKRDLCLPRRLNSSHRGMASKPDLDVQYKTYRNRFGRAALASGSSRRSLKKLGLCSQGNGWFPSNLWTIPWVLAALWGSNISGIIRL